MDHYSHIITSVRDRLYRLALRMVNDADEAEDVVQDVLVKSWKQKDRILSLDNPPAWLMRMTKHQAIDRLRSRSVRMVRETEAATTDRDVITPHRIVEGNDTLAHIHRLLQQLPADQRTVLQLREVEGMEYREIAEITGLNLAQVKSYLHRGRQKIRALLINEKII